MLPQLIATTPGNLALWICICVLLIALAVIFSLPGEQMALFQAISISLAAIFLAITVIKAANYACEGTVREFCVRTITIPGPTYKEKNGIRYIESPDAETRCVETRKFIAVNQEWKEVVR